MAFIEVNHKTLKDVAEAITTYCSTQDKEMKAADTRMKSMLSLGWIGRDATAFGNKWEGIDDSNSTSVKFRNSLKSFADSVAACASVYQSAQADAYNEADRLPR